VSPEFLAVVAPHAVEGTPSGNALVPGIAMVLMAVSLGLGRYYQSIQQELMNLSRALTAAPAGWRQSQGRNAPPTPSADAPTAVLWVSGFDALGIQSILSIAETFRDAFSQIILASVHCFDVTDAERALEANQLRSSLENSLARYGQMAELFGMALGTRIALGPDPGALEAEVAEELIRSHPRVLFFIPKPVISPERWYHRLLGPIVTSSLLRRLKLRGVVAHEIQVPVRIGAPAPRARFKGATS
jgi:hypothetical protein